MISRLVSDLRQGGRGVSCCSDSYPGTTGSSLDDRCGLLLRKVFEGRILGDL